jgi:tetratricopeptide (TPR) repeat protein
MSIEELTEQMAKAMEAAEAFGQNADATKPSLPPGHALQAGKTVDEVLADLNKSPLFMTELEENDDIAALQALNYEGTPLEDGTDFKERGNECFRARMFADAKEFYTKGVQILAAEERKRQNGEVTKNPEGEPDSEEEIAKQRSVLEGLYVNRAACHLELRNYRSCWTDCAAALRLNPANVKACYRSARALLAVGRIEEADDVCARGLALDGENKALRGLADEIISKAKERDARRKKEAEREAREKRRALLRKAALKARGIPTRTTEKPPEMEDAALALVPDPDDPRSTLSFPTVLLYPAHLETDFIKGFNEMQALEDHLSYVFPLPWDKEGAYTMAGTECYVETREGGLLKMGKRVPLLKILSTGKVEVVDEVVRIFVLPKAEAEAWVKKFKEQKAAVGGKIS